MMLSTNTYSNPSVLFYEFRELQTFKNKHKTVLKESIENNFHQVIDLIKYRIGKQSLNQIADGLKANIFDLRIALADFVVNEENLELQEVQSKGTMDEIINQIQGNNYLTLRNTIIDVLEVQSAISSSILSLVNHKKAELGKSLSANQFSYKEFESLTETHLGMLPQVEFWVKGTNESLKLEVGLIVADLLLNDDLTIPNDQFIDDLSSFLKKTVSHFGAYTMANGLWQPDQNDTSQLVTNMRILSSALMVKMGQTQPISRNGLQNMILS